MPYIYSLGAKVTFDNFTIYRALMMDFRSDANVYNITDQFMFGKEFLVCPVVRQHAQARKVYLPKNGPADGEISGTERVSLESGRMV